MSADDLPLHRFDDTRYCRHCHLSERTISNSTRSIECKPPEPAPRDDLPMQRQRAAQERRARELGMDDV